MWSMGIIDPIYWTNYASGTISPSNRPAHRVLASNHQRQETVMSFRKVAFVAAAVALVSVGSARLPVGRALTRSTSAASTALPTTPRKPAASASSRRSLSKRVCHSR